MSPGPERDPAAALNRLSELQPLIQPVADVLTRSASHRAIVIPTGLLGLIQEVRHHAREVDAHYRRDEVHPRHPLEGSLERGRVVPVEADVSTSPGRGPHADSKGGQLAGYPRTGLAGSAEDEDTTIGYVVHSSMIMGAR